MSVELWDWRRRVTDLYGELRRAAAPLAAWQQWRAVRDDLLGMHSQTPLDETVRTAFRGLAYFPYDPALRLLVRLVPIAETTVEDVPAGADGMMRLRGFARTDGLGDVLGGELTLFWIEGYGGGVFLPFADATSGRESFGGGRYLLDTIKGADLGTSVDGRIVLDFNFSYFPSCAYSPHWVCPLAPSGNRLARPVRAGERLG